MGNTNLSVKVYRDIKYMLMTLQFVPGEFLREQGVADSLGVSRTPVREAFQRLAYEGWLLVGDGRRVQVCPVTAMDVDNIFRLRMLLEPYAVEETFFRGKCRVLAGELDQALSVMRERELDRISFARLDMEFHALLVRNAGNERLIRFWKTLHEESSRIAIMTLPDRAAKEISDRTAEVMQEHTAILDSLWKKDRGATLRALDEHLVNSRNALLRKINGVLPDSAEESNIFEELFDFESVLAGNEAGRNYPRTAMST